MTIIVETKSGKAEGFEQDDIFIFKGIPYAATQMGERRWQPPAHYGLLSSAIKSFKHFGFSFVIGYYKDSVKIKR